MQSTPNQRDADPHDLFVVEPDVSLAARQETRNDKAPLDLLYDVLSRPSDPSPLRPDPELRIAPDLPTRPSVPPVAVARAADAVAPAPFVDEPATDDNKTDIQLGETEINAHQPPTGKFARNVFMGLFALVSASGAAAWQHYGDEAKAMIAQYTPSFALLSSASPSKQATAEPATDQTAAQPIAAVATAAPDQMQTIQSMQRDLTAMSQQIADLKAVIDQLKAAQPQPVAQQQPVANVSPATRAAEARLTEPAAPVVRPKIVPPPAKPEHSTVATLAKRPKQTFPYQPIAPAPPPPQQAASAAPPPPLQIAPRAEDGGPVVRPPMPLQ